MRAAVLVTAAALLGAAVHLDAPLRLFATPLSASPDTVWSETRARVGPGESVALLLDRFGMPAVEALSATIALRLPPTAVHPGATVLIRRATVHASPASHSVVRRVEVEMASDHVVRVERHGTEWRRSERRIPWMVDTAAFRIGVQSTLIAAVEGGAATLLDSAARRALAYEVTRTLRPQFNPRARLQAGDTVVVEFERAVAPDEATALRRVLGVAVRRGRHALVQVRPSPAE